VTLPNPSKLGRSHATDRLMRIFVDGPGDPDPDLRRHLASCPECRNEFTVLALADRALERCLGGAGEFSRFESDLAWNVIRAESGTNPLARRAALRTARNFLAAAATIAIFAVATAIGFWFSRSDDGFTARGSAPAPSIQAYCIRAGEPVEVRPAERPDGSLACAIGEALGFVALNPRAGVSNLALFSLPPKGEPLWYVPNPVQTAPWRIEPSGRPAPISRIIRLAINHRPGRYRLMAIFSGESFDFERTRETARALQEGRPAPAHSIVIEKTLVVEERP